MKLLLTRKAEKDLDKLDENIRQRIIKALDKFMEDPRNADIKKLKGMEIFRLRMGDYRISFEIQKETKTINVLRVRHRKESYR
ncbi:MAG: type II toxin-antitoxin system RelE/ParE family toxin [Planctomycetia bacterium]|nr:MAG: type II toxin-antitoxin system RelE/ParE family toxin [Planctomycetia bacterium]HQU32633.1 type II toxin-antitoxin system RelE/ParE family toxin [Candidatus Brocadia sapporoensis]